MTASSPPIRAIVSDIEGTTSSIRFVHDVLFPFAQRRLPAFVVTHADKPQVQHWLAEAAKEAGIVSAKEQEIIDLLLRWIDEDRKSPALKALQGMIWTEGYAAGDFKGHVYPEVAARLRAWKAQGVPVYIYSSGSIQAQRQLFAHSEAGDLTTLLSGHFDTGTGSKRSADSYRAIAEAIGLPAEQILFLSDIVEELDAAQLAGMATLMLARAPDTCPTDGHHPCVSDFDAITIQR